MLPRPADLPNFDRPPVIEAVLSLQFGSVSLTNIHSGLLWQRFKDELPTVSEHPPLDATFETFGTGPTQPQIPQFMFGLGAGMSRYWFESQDGRELLQVQNDRLISNWRKRTGDDKYPRYETIKEAFIRRIDVVEEFIRNRKLGVIAPNQCEVTYINHISLDEISDPRSHLQRIFSMWSGEYSDHRLPVVEDVGLTAKYILKGEDGSPEGRLHAQIQPAVQNADGRLIIRFSLTARGKPKDQSIAGSLAWFDRGRDAVVRGFTSMTTQEMHKRWGRTDVG